MPDVANETVKEAVNAAPQKVEAPKKDEAKVKEDKPKAKKTRAPRARKVEELVDLVTSKMTDKEKDVLIKYLREEINVLNQKIDALRQTSEKAFEQTRLREQQYNEMEQYFKTQLGYVDAQVVAFAAAVRKATTGGIN